MADKVQSIEAFKVVTAEFKVTTVFDVVFPPHMLDAVVATLKDLMATSKASNATIVVMFESADDK